MSGLAHRAGPVVLAAPSGTGKTTIARALVDRFPDFVFSVSATTRAPRPGERDGVDYHFVSRERFQAMADAGELAEWATVHDRCYGTVRTELAAAAAAGRHAVLDIDVQGAMQIRDSVPEAILIFVLPPSTQTLVGRLEGRGTERSHEVARRLRSAVEELGRAPDFDYVLVNDDLERCIQEVQTIVSAEGYRPERAQGLGPAVAALREEIDELLKTDFAEVG